MSPCSERAERGSAWPTASPPRPRAIRPPRPGQHALDLRREGRRNARLGRRRQGVSRLHERHRRPEHGPSASPRRPRRARADRARHAHVLSGRDVRAVRGAGGPALRARRRLTAGTLQGRALHDRHRGDRERDQGRPRVHEAARGGGVQRRVPRTHAAQPHHDVVEPRVSPELRTARTRHPPRAVP